MDSFERRGNDAQSAQRHAGSEDRFGRGVADERDPRLAQPDRGTASDHLSTCRSVLRAVQ